LGVLEDVSQLLIARESGELLAAVDLSDRLKLTLGRSPRCDVRLDAPAVSRRHGLLLVHDDRWLMLDTGSTTGIHTVEGNCRLAQLSRENWIRLGPFYFWLDGDSDEPSGVLSATSSGNGAGDTLYDLLYGSDEQPATNGRSPSQDRWPVGEDSPGSIPLLHVRDLHGKPLEEIDLRALEKLTIGRSTACDLVVDDPAVSRLHCVMYVEGSRWCVADADSSGGTLVDGRRTHRTRLTDRKLIRIGEHLLWVDHPVLDEIEQTERKLAKLPTLRSEAGPIRPGEPPSAFLKPERPGTMSGSDREIQA
jgi:pSer/pThr/pTyr-binding forkhead associated (FHA) protein